MPGFLYEGPSLSESSDGPFLFCAVEELCFDGFLLPNSFVSINMAYMTKMTRRKSELLALIEQSPAMSIYQLAQTCGRNYRRVYDHVQQLAAAGYVRIRSGVRNGRRVSIVESIYHQRLRRLDDLYAFKVKADAAC